MQWDELFRRDRNCLLDPAEEVVRFIGKHLCSWHDVRSVLDIGFGAGRHIVHFARLGYEVSGIDISRTGKLRTEQWLTREGLSARLDIADMRDLPYSGDIFDAAVCRGVITHADLEGVR